MRIISGAFRGTRLRSFPDQGIRGERPTTSRARTVIFDILANNRDGDIVNGARVLDLFAGTGAMGLEALSRGAAWATFVDRGKTAESIIRHNIERTRTGHCTRILRRDARSLPASAASHHELVIADPPYASEITLKSLQNALNTGWFGPESWLVVEDDSEFQGLDQLDIRMVRTVGSTVITIGRIA